MNNLTKTKLISYLAAIFLAGGVTGATVAVTAGKQMMAEPPRNGHIETRYLKERFQSKLGLTPEQIRSIEPILETMSEQLKNIRGETSKRIAAVVKNSYDQIGKDLTPEQRQKLEEMKRDRQDNSRRKFKSPGEWPRKSNESHQNP
jgi:gas vesicle protein